MRSFNFPYGTLEGTDIPRSGGPAVTLTLSAAAKLVDHKDPAPARPDPQTQVSLQRRLAARAVALKVWAARKAKAEAAAVTKKEEEKKGNKRKGEPLSLPAPKRQHQQFVPPPPPLLTSPATHPEPFDMEAAAQAMLVRTAEQRDREALGIARVEVRGVYCCSPLLSSPPRFTSNAGAFRLPPSWRSVSLSASRIWSNSATQSIFATPPRTMRCHPLSSEPWTGPWSMCVCDICLFIINNSFRLTQSSYIKGRMRSLMALRHSGQISTILGEHTAHVTKCLQGMNTTAGGAPRHTTHSRVPAVTTPSPLGMTSSVPGLRLRHLKHWAREAKLLTRHPEHTQSPALTPTVGAGGARRPTPPPNPSGRAVPHFLQLALWA